MTNVRPATKGRALPKSGPVADNNPAPDAKEGANTSPNPGNAPGHTIASLNPDAQVQPNANLNPMSNGYGNNTLLKDPAEEPDGTFAPLDKETGEVWLRAIRDTMYDSDSGLYFFTTKATRVEMPASPWLKMQVDAKLIGHADKDFRHTDTAPAPESFNA